MRKLFTTYYKGEYRDDRSCFTFDESELEKISYKTI